MEETPIRFVQSRPVSVVEFRGLHVEAVWRAYLVITVSMLADQTPARPTFAFGIRGRIMLEQELVRARLQFICDLLPLVVFCVPGGHPARFAL